MGGISGTPLPHLACRSVESLYIYLGRYYMGRYYMGRYYLHQKTLEYKFIP